MTSKSVCTILVALSLGVLSTAVATAQSPAAKPQAAAVTTKVMANAPSSVRATTYRQSSEDGVKLYKLHNHPSNLMGPPLYGLRFDDLLGNGVYTFNFDYSDGSGSTSMSLEVDDTAGTIHIWGRAFGGLDTGGAYDANQSGWVDIDFMYRANILIADNPLGGLGDDMFVLYGDVTNNGTIRLLGWGGDQTIEITDVSHCAYTFMFDNDFDHMWNASFVANPLIWSGSGWLLTSDPETVLGSRNWSFWAQELVAVAVQEKTWTELKRMFAQ